MSFWEETEHCIEMQSPHLHLTFSKALGGQFWVNPFAYQENGT